MVSFKEHTSNGHEHEWANSGSCTDCATTKVAQFYYQDSAALMHIAQEQ